MFVSDCLNINSQGNLTIGGADTVALAERFKTPLYVMDETQIRTACSSFKKSIDKFYDGNGLAVYASKAFCCKEMCRIVESEGLGIDVVSGGELYTAKSVNFPADRIVFHGNNKTVEELTSALEYGVGRIVVDNIFELELLNKLAKSADKKARIMFRVKPGIDAHTHDFVRTGQIDSKFGFALETGEAMSAIESAISMENIELVGLHCHIGSQIFDIDPFELAAEVMVKLMADAKSKFGYEIPELNLGGGFGIKYMPEHDPQEYERYMERVSGIVKAKCSEFGLSVPFILIEPGRSIVGPAGITLYTAGAVKEIPNIRTYVSVDGGMADNPRYALYKSEYTAVVANKADKPFNKTVTIAGKCCESGDLIGEGMKIQEVEAGDIIAVLATGAYNYSMASNYNRLPKPAVVMIKDGEARIIIKRETVENVASLDV